MPVLDTEVLFGFNPHDARHDAVKGLLERSKVEAVEVLYLPDTTLLEYTMTLRAKGKTNKEIKQAVKSVKSILLTSDITEVNTISTELAILHYSLLEEGERTFFDALIAASTLQLDNEIVSDDEVFDRIENIRRIPLTRKK